MRLSELEPRWTGFPRVLSGLTFLCPICRTQRLGVVFTPPIDPDGWWEKMCRPTYEGVNVWIRTGETFDDLTLTPSIDASINDRIDVQGHWHGFVYNGEVTAYQGEAAQCGRAKK